MFLAPGDALVRGERFQHQLAGGDCGFLVGRGGESGLVDQREEPLDQPEGGKAGCGGLVDADLERATLLEPGDDGLDIGLEGMFGEDQAGGAPNQLSCHRLRSLHFPLVLQLDLPRNRRNAGIDVAHPGHRPRRAGGNRAALRVADHHFQQGDREPLRHAGAAVHTRIFAGGEGDLFDRFGDE